MDKQLSKQNSGIMSLSVIILVWTLLVACLAKADISDLFGRGAQPGPCKSVKVKPLTAAQHYDEGMIQKENKKYCPAMENFQRAFVLSDDPTMRDNARFNRIESAFYQMDYELFFSEGERYLKIQKPGSTPNVERVHFLMIKGAYEMFAEAENKKMWNDLLLGVSKLQEPADSTKKFYSIPLFLESHRDSIYAKEVKDLLLTLRNDTAKSMLTDAQRLWSLGEFVPAMGRAKWVVSQGAYLPEFPVALYTLIRITDSFSASLTLKDKVDDKKLAEWLSVEPSDITPEVKKQLSDSLHQEALKLVAMMREQLPNDPWTFKLNYMYTPPRK